jgi:hypothetical protein
MRSFSRAFNLIFVNLNSGDDGALKDVAIKDRFFVEAGAFDGSVLSNSLFLELMHKWTGLLVSIQIKMSKWKLGEETLTKFVN